MFYVHAALLTRASPFFRAAFDGGFRETASRRMLLAEERPDDVRFLLCWLYWRVAVGDGGGVGDEEGCGRRCGGRGRDGGDAGSLWHAQIDPRLVALAKYNAEKAVVAKAAAACGGGDDVVSELIVPKPGPPAFGPLVRLWLLAERLDVGMGLRDEICERVLHVSRLAGCVVPGREDVGVLWADGSGSGSERGKLRKLVLDLYVGMRCQGLVGGKAREDGGWDEGFLTDLVVRLMDEIHGEWSGKGQQQQGRRNGDGGVVGVEGQGDEDVVMVGRLRRKRCDYHEHS